jgi:citrate synthase
MKAGQHYLTARQAAEALGVTRPTLYAYASRGQLRSELVPGRPRERRYRREDLQRLLEGKEARRDPARAAARGLHWGGPVLESGITLIHNGRFYYRGHDAVTLSETASLEQAAVLLWAAAETEREGLFDQHCPLPRRQLAHLRTCS